MSLKITVNKTVKVIFNYLVTFYCSNHVAVFRGQDKCSRQL